MYNIVIGGFFHESNTFNPIITGEDDFLIFYGSEIFENRDSYILAKGIIEYFETRDDINLIPTVFGKAVPNGEVSKSLWETKLKGEYIDRLKSIDCKVDGVLLALHGSMRVEDIGDAEGEILSLTREILPDIPIISALDMHATMSEDMLNYCDGFVGFKTAPHVDVYETGFHAAKMMDEILTTGVKTKISYRKLPFLIAGERSESTEYPMNSLIDHLKECEKDDRVMAASYLLGFPWADCDDNGVTALVVTRDDQKLGDSYAENLINKFDHMIDKFSFTGIALEPEDCVKSALEDLKTINGPIYISDSGDNPTAGSTGDNTQLLNILNNEDLKGRRIVYGGIFDKRVAEECRDLFNSGERKSIEISVGAHYDPKFPPVKLKGSIKAVTEHFGFFKSIVVLFETEKFKLLITSKHIGFIDKDIFQSVGVECEDQDIVIVKLGYLTDPFKEITTKSYLALTRGATDQILSRFNYSKEYRVK